MSSCSVVDLHVGTTKDMKLRRLKKLQAFKSAHYLREVSRGYVKRLSTAEETRARIQEKYPGPWVGRLYCFNQK